MTKLKHIATNKVYDWDGIDHAGKVWIRTNAEVYPEDFYDFSPSELDGQTQYYVKEPLADFEIMEDK